MSKYLKLADTCEECMYRNEFFKVRNELKAIERKLVRCQDCKYWVSNFNGCSRNPCTEPWYATDFCSYGERIEE